MAVADILLTPAVIYYAPVGETPPDENDIAFGEAWGGNWTNVGYTNIPLSMSFETETYEVNVEQSTLPVKELKVKETVTFETALVEITADNLALAFPGSTVIETPAGAAQVAMEEIEVGGSPTVDNYTWGFEGEYKDDSNVSFPVRIFVWKANAILNGQLQFAKNKEVGIPLQIKAKADLTKAVGAQLFKFQKVTAAATGS